MSENIHIKRAVNNDGWNSTGLLVALLVLAMFLTFRLCYSYISDSERFPIIKIKIVASYEHITHQQLKSVLSNHIGSSFFMLSITDLKQDLKKLTWVDKVAIEKIWPDSLKITLIEKKPVAFFNRSILTKDGLLIPSDEHSSLEALPNLSGPVKQKDQVLQVYKKLSNILIDYGLKSNKLHLRDNQAWEMSLVNGIDIYLGKKDIEQRLLRFCKAYPALLTENTGPPARVDLRYPRAMAIRWKH